MYENWLADGIFVSIALCTKYNKCTRYIGEGGAIRPGFGARRLRCNGGR